MEIVSAYDIASANLAVALSDNVVSTEHRQAMTEAVGENLDNMIDALNTVVSAYNRMVYEGRYQAGKAPLAVKAEYREMGFNKILNYRFFDGVIKLFYDRENFPTQDSLDRIKAIFEINTECPCARVKAGVDTYCLRLLSHAGLVTQDLDFTKELLARINSYDRSLMDEAILPSAIVTEL